jgi:oligosaccharide 4-alpha-D-glucosyltransferase
MRRPRTTLLSVARWLLYVLSVPAGATTLGDYTGYEQRAEGLVLHAGEASVVITQYTNQIVRISLRPHDEPGLDSSQVIVLGPQAVNWTVDVQDSVIEVSAGAIAVQARRYPLRLSVSVGGMLYTQDEDGFVWQGAERAVRLRMGVGEHFYGGGERADGLDHRGHTLVGYNAPSYCYGDGATNLSIAVPLLVSSGKYGLYFEDSYPHTIDLGASTPDVLAYTAQGGELSYFVIASSVLPDVIEKYTELAGRQPLPPRWALGYLQSRYGYESETQARSIVSAFRAQQIPLDVLILDLYWFGWGQMGDLDWDRSHWNNPVGMMADFAATGVKTVLITEPYILQSSSNFQTCYNSGYLTPDSTGTPVIMPQFWAGTAGLLDITSANARSWYWNFYRSRMNEGAGGWWSDLGEPELHPEQMRHAGGSAAQVHNEYSLLWAKTLSDGYAADFPTRRLFNLIRSGYAGMQRFSTFPWSGDVQRTFSGMRAQLPIMLNMGMSGVAMIGCDIGGLDCGALDPELYTRWMQMGAFAPLMRAHGWNVPTEPVNFDSTTRRIVGDYIRLRYRLLPYNYTLAWENHQSGMPLVRPLCFEEQNVFTADLYDEYLWGPSFLVAPVTVGGGEAKRVYLPGGNWVDYWTEATYAGGRNAIVPAPLERMPLLVRAGSIIPSVPVVQSTEDYNTDTLIVDYYPDPAVSGTTFRIYDDDGRTPNADELGQYEQVSLTAEWLATTFALGFGRNNQGYADAPASRKFYCRIHRVAASPLHVRLNAGELTWVADSAQFANADSAVYWNPAAGLLQVGFRTSRTADVVAIDGLHVLDAPRRESAAPRDLKLAAAYPNPFNSTVTLEYSLPQRERVTLRVYDVTGREVAVLLEATMAAGEHFVRWDARAEPSGVYLVRMSTASGDFTTKVVLLR